MRQQSVARSFPRGLSARNADVRSFLSLDEDQQVQIRRACDEEPKMNDAAPAPMPVTASVVVQPMGYSRYTEESGNRAVVTPVDMLDTGYPMRYEAGQRWGPGPKLYLFADLPAAACTIGSIIRTEHVNGSP